MSKKASGWANVREKSTYYLFGPHLEKDEKILYIVHRHPFLLVKGFFKIFVLTFLSPVFLWMVFPEIWFVFLIWVLYGIIMLNKLIFNWYFDVILVTDMSLIDVTWNGPFDRNSTRVEYQMVEGTAYTFKGILQTVFNYGTIKINRESGVVGLELKDAVNPAKVESIIMSYKEKYISDKNFEDSKALKRLLGEMIKKHTQEMKEVEVDF
jgi:hypothetical protein